MNSLFSAPQSLIPGPPPSGSAGLRLPPMPEAAAPDFEDFFENGVMPLHIVGPNGTILRANKAELDLLGYTADEYIGRPIAEFHADTATIREILGRLGRGERLDKFPARLRAKDGSMKHVLVSSSVQFRDGNFINTRCFTTDVTELTNAQDALRSNERHLRTILDGLPAAVYATDAQGVVTYYNPAAVALAGREPRLGHDRWCVTWRIFTPEGQFLPHDQCPMAIALKEGRAVRGIEAVAERPDGVRTPFLPFPTPLHDENGHVVGAINVLVDIKDRKESETRQQLLLNELNHRIKNNLQMLQSLLRASLRETKSEEAQTVLGDAVRRVSAIAAAQRILYTTGDTATFEAEEFLNAVCQSARQSFPQNVAISVRSAQGYLNNDISLPLSLCLNELLTNAVKHGLKAKADSTVTVEMKINDAGVEVVVEDEGCGFEFKADGVRPSSGMGLVLGLTNQMGGVLSVQCAGTTRCVINIPKQRAMPNLDAS